MTTNLLIIDPARFDILRESYAHKYHEYELQMKLSACGFNIETNRAA